MLNQILRQLIRETDSVNQLAADCGVSQQTLQKFVSGSRQNLRTDTADKLLEHFGLRVFDPASLIECIEKVGSEVWRITGEYNSLNPDYSKDRELGRKLEELRGLLDCAREALESGGTPILSDSYLRRSGFGPWDE